MTRPIGTGGPAMGLNRQENEAMLAELARGCNGERNRAIWILGTTTAMRAGEILGLRIRDVWVDRGADESGILRKVVLDKSRTKSKRSRVLPVPSSTRLALARWLIQRGGPRRPSDWLFPSSADPRKPASYKRLEKAIVRAGHRIGLSHVRSHSMRRTCANGWRAQREDLEKIRELLGHSSLKTTQVYLRISDEEMDTAAEKHADHLYQDLQSTPS